MIIVVFLVVAAISAQAPIDLSGTWIRDAERSTSVGGGRGGRGGGDGGGQGGGLGLGQIPDVLVIKQDAATVTIEEHRGTAVSRVVYRLDGKAATNKISAGRSAAGISTAVSTWKDGRLVTTIAYPLTATSTATVEMQETRSIDRDGLLVVETTIKDQPNLRRAVYRRSK